MKDIRNLIADTLVGWAIRFYTDDDLKFSLVVWVIKTNFIENMQKVSKR